MAADLPESPWRPIFEEIRLRVGKRRDEQGVLGSINWLRQEMEKRGANPNVVRNIIYRNKGKLEDKRVLFDIIKQLWHSNTDKPLQAPELEALLSAESGAEQEVAQLLGREKRRAYSAFVGAVRSGQAPKLIITGKPGAGKTLLVDYIQQALELPPKASDKLVRFDFGGDLVTSLTQFALRLGIRRELVESKLVKVVAKSAYAVQADAQAEIARTIVDALKGQRQTSVLLLHLSQTLTEQDHLALSALRLNTDDVPRVNAAEWLWFNLLEPLSALSDVSLLVSIVNVPARALQNLGAFDGPLKLNPPTASEARRFIRARLPRLSAAGQEAIVARAGRSFEELRTLALLSEIREPLTEESETVAQLGDLLDKAGDPRLRDFLRALAVVTVPAFASFEQAALLAVRDGNWQRLSDLELAFLDVTPGKGNSYRCFSRRLARRLKEQFTAAQPDDYRERNARAARFYEALALAEPSGEEATRYLYHLLEARDWTALEHWLARWSIPQALLRRVWGHAEVELVGERFERIALQVAAHYVRLGSFEHPDAARAFALLERSEQADVRLWTRLKRAEGAVLQGHADEAERLLEGADTETGQRPDLEAERALIKASIARWRGDLPRAAQYVERARPLLAQEAEEDGLLRAKVAVWAGLIAKDGGDLGAALAEFGSVTPGDDLVAARVAFQTGDILLRLGRFDAALGALDRAVTLARQSEALVHEQTRYLSRRADLHRARGDLRKAQRDFIEALEPLEADGPEELETAFWAAKVKDERALYQLASAEFSEAIAALRDNQAVFRRYGQDHSADTTYRTLRSRLRLALSYGLRAYGTPLGEPFLHLGGPTNALDLRHAQRLLAQIQEDLSARVEAGSAFDALHRRALLTRSLFSESPRSGLEAAERALDLSRFDYQKAEACAHMSLAHLRAGEAERGLHAAREGAGFLEHVSRAHGGERGDVSTRFWLYSLAARAHLLRQDVASAAEVLEAGLREEAQPHSQESLLRAFGESADLSLEGARQHPLLRSLFGQTLADETVRLPDLLVAHWREVGLRSAVLQ